MKILKNKYNSTYNHVLFTIVEKSINDLMQDVIESKNIVTRGEGFNKHFSNLNALQTLYPFCLNLENRSWINQSPQRPRLVIGKSVKILKEELDFDRNKLAMFIVFPN